MRRASRPNWTPFASVRAVIIDCPPALSWLTIDAFTASDRVLIPVAPGYFELDSIVQISKTVQEVCEYFNPQITLAGFLYTMSDPTINAKTSLRILRQTYTDAVLKTIIPRNTGFKFRLHVPCVSTSGCHATRNTQHAAHSTPASPTSWPARRSSSSLRRLSSGRARR